MSFHLWLDVSVVLAGGFTGVTSGSKHSPAGKMHQIRVLYVMRVVEILTDPTLVFLNCVCMSPHQPLLSRHLSNLVM